MARAQYECHDTVCRKHTMPTIDCTCLVFHLGPSATTRNCSSGPSPTCRIHGRHDRRDRFADAIAPHATFAVADGKRR